MTITAVYAGVMTLLMWLTVDYLISHARLIGDGTGAGEIAIYMITGLLILFILFMIAKPAFILRGSNDEDIAITRRAQPKVFEALDALCAAMHIDAPGDVRVSTDANASAATLGKSRDRPRRNVLTLGLALAAGMDLRSFVGVIAHELGHFAQRRTNRMQGLVGRILVWFALAVYGRDRFDLWVMRGLAGHVIFRPFFYVLRVLLIIGRMFLWVFMKLSEAASATIARQAEYDSDRYAAQIAGSHGVGTMLQRTSVLALASNLAEARIETFWHERRLPDDLPAWTIHAAESFTEEQQSALIALLRQHGTGMFDTHPSLVQRIAAARRLKCRGVVHDERNAFELFDNFEDLCRNSTTQFYLDRLGEKTNEVALVPTQVLASEHESIQQAGKKVCAYFQGEPWIHFPFLPTAFALKPCPDTEKMLAALDKARHKTVDAAKVRNDSLDQCAASFGEMIHLRAIQVMLGAAPDASVNMHQLNMEYHRVQRVFQESEQKMTPHLEAMQLRMVLALRTLQTDEMSDRLESLDREQLRSRARVLIPIAIAINEFAPQMRNLTSNMTQISVLFERYKGLPPQNVCKRTVAPVIHSAQLNVDSIRKSAASLKYPFEHAQQDMGLADFLAPPPEDAANQMDRIQAVDLCLSRVQNLSIRVMSELGSICGEVETALGYEAPPVAAQNDFREEMNQVVETSVQSPANRNAGHAESLTAIVMACAAMLVVGFLTIAFVGAARNVPAVLPKHKSYKPTTVPTHWQQPAPVWKPWTPPKPPKPYQPNIPGMNQPNTPNKNQPWRPNHTRPGSPKPKTPSYRPTPPRPGPSRPPSRPKPNYNRPSSPRPGPSRPGPSFPRPGIPR